MKSQLFYTPRKITNRATVLHDNDKFSDEVKPVTFNLLNIHEITITSILNSHYLENSFLKTNRKTACA